MFPPIPCLNILSHQTWRSSPVGGPAPTEQPGTVHSGGRSRVQAVDKTWGYGSHVSGWATTITGGNLAKKNITPLHQCTGYQKCLEFGDDQNTYLWSKESASAVLRLTALDLLIRTDCQSCERKQSYLCHDSIITDSYGVIKILSITL